MHAQGAQLYEAWGGNGLGYQASRNIKQASTKQAPNPWGSPFTLKGAHTHTEYIKYTRARPLRTPQDRRLTVGDIDRLRPSW